MQAPLVIKWMPQYGFPYLQTIINKVSMQYKEYKAKRERYKNSPVI